MAKHIGFAERKTLNSFNLLVYTSSEISWSDLNNIIEIIDFNQPNLILKINNFLSIKKIAANNIYIYSQM